MVHNNIYVITLRQVRAIPRRGINVQCKVRVTASVTAGWEGGGGHSERFFFSLHTKQIFQKCSFPKGKKHQQLYAFKAKGID